MLKILKKNINFNNKYVRLYIYIPSSNSTFCLINNLLSEAKFSSPSFKKGINLNFSKTAYS